MDKDVIYNYVRSSGTYPDPWKKNKPYEFPERCRKCTYRSSVPAEYSCDFAFITGRCRTAEVSDPELLNPKKCPFYSNGVRKNNEKLHRQTRTRVDKDVLIRMHSQGCTDGEIANYFGVSKSTVEKYRYSLGLQNYRKNQPNEVDYEKMWGLYRAGYYDAQIAEACGCSISAVRKFRKNNSLPSTEENKNNARAMMYKQLYEKGHSDGEIGAATGVSAGAVLNWRRKHNLPMNKGKDGKKDG